MAQSANWRDEARTAVALELAAAKLLAVCATPVMPRFAKKLAESLGCGPITRWPGTVALVEPGSAIDLAERVFFRVPGAAEPAELGWLQDTVTALVQTEGDITGRTLTDLGATSLHAVTLQYQILEHSGVELGIDELLGSATVAELAARLPQRDVEAVPA